MAAGKRKSDGLKSAASPPRKRHSLPAAGKASSQQPEISEDDASPKEKRGYDHENDSQSSDDKGGLGDEEFGKEGDEAYDLEEYEPRFIERFEAPNALEAMAQFYYCLEQQAIEAMKAPGSFDRPLGMSGRTWVSMISEKEGDYLRVSWPSVFNLQDDVITSSPLFDPMEKAPRAVSWAVTRLLKEGVHFTGEDPGSGVPLRNGVACYVLGGSLNEGSLVAFHFTNLLRNNQEASMHRMKEIGEGQAKARAIEEARDRAMWAAKPAYKKRIPPPIVDFPAALRIEATKGLRYNQAKEAGTWHLENRRIEETGMAYRRWYFLPTAMEQLRGTPSKFEEWHRGSRRVCFSCNRCRRMEGDLVALVSDSSRSGFPLSRPGWLRSRSSADVRQAIG